MSSSAQEVFRKNYAKLLEAIDSPTQFASHFYDEELISKSTRDAVSEVGNTRVREDKAAQLIRAVETMVNLNPNVMHKVIRVLRRHPTSEHLANEMAAQGNL